MSVTVELSELDAFLWDAFKRGGEWVAASEYRKLMAENAELRESLEYANNEWEKESMEYLSTQDQNVKLRELVKSMYYDLTHMTFPPDWVTDYEADMRELGVKVDDD